MTSIVPASFNVSVGATLQSFLNQAQGTTTDTSLFGVLKNGSVGGGTNSILGALQSNGNGTSAASATATALGSGGIKKIYHSVLQAIGADPGGTLTEHWNTNGTEPSTLVTLRSYGWIKLTAKQFDPAAKTSVGSYQFTPVGYAIYQRTGGAPASAPGALTSSTLNGTSSSTTGAASSQTAAIASTLASLGLNSSSIAALAGNSTTSSAGSGSVVYLVA